MVWDLAGAGGDIVVDGSTNSICGVIGIHEHTGAVKQHVTLDLMNDMGRILYKHGNTLFCGDYDTRGTKMGVLALSLLHQDGMPLYTCDGIWRASSML